MPADSHRFSKSKRLLSPFDYKRVFDSNDQRAGSRHALVLSVINSTETSRLGLVIAKKHVRQANQRNRIKRIVREFFRNHPLSPHRDIVFLARNGLGQLSNEEIRQTLIRLWSTIQAKPDDSP